MDASAARRYLTGQPEVAHLLVRLRLIAGPAWGHGAVLVEYVVPLPETWPLYLRLWHSRERVDGRAHLLIDRPSRKDIRTADGSTGEETAAPDGR